MNRREFLAATGATLLATACRNTAPPLPPGELLGQDATLGHKLRDGSMPPPTEEKRVPVLIAGGGIAGLSAAWWLQRNGFSDFLLLEGEREAGGNSRSGKNAVSAYPWAAHYLPIPGVEAEYTRLLLAELGVIKGDPRAPKPEYEERYLCAAPAERLFIHGRWQEGLTPQHGVPSSERAEFARFDELIRGWRARKGRDGKRAFALPMALSSRDPDILALDRISMHDWLMSHNLKSPAVHWYANYACRDDYGTNHKEASAWAGLHYFCARTGEASNAEHETVLTWPEGNGWLATRLQEKVAPHIRTGHWVWRIGTDNGRAWADVYLAQENRSVRYHAERLIWAGPMFLLPYVWTDAPEAVRHSARAFTHAPWLIANLTLSAHPASDGGAEMAWDNVLYNSPGLGYINATHQNLQVRKGPTVFTYYRALSDRPPSAARADLLAADYTSLARQVMADLTPAHADLPQLVTRCDIWRWGHAMVRPTVGFVHGAARQQLASAGKAPILLAHADLSGLSIFEEAQYRGVMAAQAVLRRG
ncbi:Protoporphyrinogen oxidase [Formivibrio citricus]|uniref:Protoporphyrinogen oxidase n=1 Tax=Formivibrio citricus TaxID=83765 RepID=A0A1I5A6Y0_9NEIS|nr:NAD(P)/FAD-dependent oxidoreductase [Formivibrio citricus]SFN57949.1 Protoporphyrinogen oxidase [Formivibrio citricus]